MGFGMDTLIFGLTLSLVAVSVVSSVKSKRLGRLRSHYISCVVNLNLARISLFLFQLPLESASFHHRRRHSLLWPC
jgi:hypothetical protein